MELHSHADFDNENDIFYADLKRQILQLTADDGEAVQETKCFNSLSIRNKDPTKSSIVLPRYTRYINGWEKHNTYEAPAWLENLWRRGHGTGVFIPQTLQSRNHSPARMMNKGNKRIYKRVQV